MGMGTAFYGVNWAPWSKNKIWLHGWGRAHIGSKSAPDWIQSSQNLRFFDHASSVVKLTHKMEESSLKDRLQAKWKGVGPYHVNVKNEEKAHIAQLMKAPRELSCKAMEGVQPWREAFVGIQTFLAPLTWKSSIWSVTNNFQIKW